MPIPLTDSCVNAVERAREMAGDAATGDHVMLVLLQKDSVVSSLLDEGAADVHGLRRHLEELCVTETGSLDALLARAAVTSFGMGKGYIGEDFLFYAVLENTELRTTTFLAEHCFNLPRLVLAVLVRNGYPGPTKRHQTKRLLESLGRAKVDWDVPSNCHRQFVRGLASAFAAEHVVVWRADSAHCVYQCPEGAATNSSRLQDFLAQDMKQEFIRVEGMAGRDNFIIFNRFGHRCEFVLEVEVPNMSEMATIGMRDAVAKICASQST